MVTSHWHVVRQATSTVMKLDNLLVNAIICDAYENENINNKMEHELRSVP